MPWIRNHAQLLAFILIAVVMSIGLKMNADAGSDKLYKAQLVACERANDLRAENNRRINSHIVDRDSLRDFLTAARIARLNSFEKEGDPVEKATADDYQRLIKKLDTQVTFKKVRLVNCNEEVKKP